MCGSQFSPATIKSWLLNLLSEAWERVPLPLHYLTHPHLPFHALLFTVVQSSEGPGIKNNDVTVLGFLVALKNPVRHNQNGSRDYDLIQSPCLCSLPEDIFVSVL